MSEQLMRYFQLAEINVVRLACGHCEGITEVCLDQVEKYFANGCCKVCGQPFGVVDDGVSSPYKGSNWLVLFARAVAVLKSEDTKVSVEFAIPAKEVCKLERV